MLNESNCQVESSAMGEVEEYTVRVGRTAGQLIYEDREGTLYFSFDIKPSADIVMESISLEPPY
jgi:hypothetical protein